MTDEWPGNRAISALVDIARNAGADLSDAQRGELPRLISDGLIARKPSPDDGSPAKYAVTREGQRLLDARGIGANES